MQDPKLQTGVARLQSESDVGSSRLRQGICPLFLCARRQYSYIIDLIFFLFYMHSVHGPILPEGMIIIVNVVSCFFFNTPSIYSRVQWRRD